MSYYDKYRDFVQLNRAIRRKCYAIDYLEVPYDMPYLCHKSTEWLWP